MSGSFTFNGISSASFGLLVNNVSNFGAPSRVVDRIQVPYRNGALLLDTGTYTNYIVTYQVALINDAIADTRALAKWLLQPQGYCELSDSYNTGEFRYAAYYNDLNYTMAHLNRYGQATISFDCKPQRYLTSGQEAIEITGDVRALANPTGFVSNPLVVITGNGTCSVGGASITVTNNSHAQTITIDSESMQCYRGSTNMNAYVTMPSGFPKMDADTTTVDVGTVGKIDITPRWWQL